MISRTSEIPDLNKYATKTLENDRFIHPERGKLCLGYLLIVVMNLVIFLITINGAYIIKPETNLLNTLITC